MDRNLLKCAGLLGVWTILLIGSLATASSASKKEIISQANPHPSIFNESPYNRNSPTVEPTATPGSVLQPPLPETQQTPSAVVTPNNGLVSITLTNQTAASINYQVIENTNQRSLPGKSSVVLQNLKIPVTVTFKRQDGGLLQVSPQATSQPEMLSVTFTETTDLGIDRSAMRIQSNGAVLLN